MYFWLTVYAIVNMQVIDAIGQVGNIEWAPACGIILLLSIPSLSHSGRGSQ